MCVLTPVATQSPQDRMQMRALHSWDSPKNRLPAPLQTVKAPGRERKRSALPETQETPLPQRRSQTVRFKELFHSGKRKARVKRKSEGHCHRQLVRGGERGDPGSTRLQPCQHLLLTPRTQCAPRSLPLPKSPAASPPSTGTHHLPHLPSPLH